MATPQPQPYNEPATVAPYIEATSMAPPKAEPVPFDKQYDQSPAPRPIDESFPKSSQLYQQLCEEFGPNNVSPLPMWLVDASDRERAHWYKFGSNAYLYFLHKTPKYRATVQKLVDTPTCCYCCMYSKHLNQKAYYGREIMELISTARCSDLKCLICCPWFYIFTFCYHNYSIVLMYPREIKTGLFGCCAWSEFGSTRRDFYSTLQQAGIKTSDPCCPCLTAVCCSLCAATQYKSILRYYEFKRFGFRAYVSNDNRPLVPYASKFATYISAAARHEPKGVNGFSTKTDSAGFLSSSSGIRELDLDRTYYHNFGADPFLEWSNPQLALERHNSKWGAALTLPPPVSAEEVVMK